MTLEQLSKAISLVKNNLFVLPTAKFLQVQHADENFPFVSRLQTPVVPTKQLTAVQVSWIVTFK